MANKPITREEMLLNAVATGEAVNLEPITREEMFLAKLGGADVTTPTPITRKERFLQKAIENGGNAGGGGNEGGDTDIYKTQLIGMIDGTVTEITASDGATKVRDYAFYGCSSLTTADFPAATSVGTNAFCLCSKLTALILRNTAGVCTLSSTSALNFTLIKSGTGHIYVPSALVDSYKSATNWSTYGTQFRALEDYTVDGTITGELDPGKTGVTV